MEVWPRYAPGRKYKTLVTQELAKYKPILEAKYKPYLQQYDPKDDYLHWGKHKQFRSMPGHLRLDHEGVPQIKYGNDYYYNPVTVCQYALTMHGKHKLTLAGKDQFLAAVDRLLTMQDQDGAFRYPFSFPYFRKTFEPGWVSGMSQGHALSVLSRAYHLTGNEKYLQAGNAALDFLLLPVSEGGTMTTMKDLHPSLNTYLIFEEYPVEPSSYTLNGFLFTLLGLYDWSQLEPISNAAHANSARDYFNQGIRTARHLLQYFDLGGYSTYDLRHLVYRTEPKLARTYHAVHLYQLYALHSITKEKVFLNYFRLWQSYIQ